jgi:hypothetical protein
LRPIGFIVDFLICFEEGQGRREKREKQKKGKREEGRGGSSSDMIMMMGWVVMCGMVEGEYDLICGMC